MNFFIICVPFLIVTTTCKPQSDKILEGEQTEHSISHEQGANSEAMYEYSSSIQDHINDLTQQRLEVRNGVHVKGMYSYSDGFFRRTIRYEADDKGYKIIGHEVTPLQGPKIDPNGIASIETKAHGKQLQYEVQSVTEDIPDDS